MYIFLFNCIQDLDSYIKTRAPVTFLSELRGHLQVSQEPGQRYNIPLMNALVLYVGSQAIAYIHSKGSTPSMSTITHSSHMDIFQNLVVDLDTEGMWTLIVCFVNEELFVDHFSCSLSHNIINLADSISWVMPFVSFKKGHSQFLSISGKLTCAKVIDSLNFLWFAMNGLVAYGLTKGVLLMCFPEVPVWVLKKTFIKSVLESHPT